MRTALSVFKKFAILRYFSGARCCFCYGRQCPPAVAQCAPVAV